MDPATIGALLGGVGQLAGGVGGLFGRGGGAVMQSMAPQQMFSAQTLLDLNLRDFAFQRDLAQKGIQWRVDDAKAAGLHPLFALGGGQAGFTPPPLSVGQPDPGSITGGGGGPDIGGAFANMGQGLGRAIAATQTKEQRVLDQFEVARRAQMLEKGALENQYLQVQINKATAPAVGPPMPGPGFEIKPTEVTAPMPGAPHITAGPGHPGTEFVRMPSGGYMPAPAKPLQIDEVSSPGYFTWMMQNKIIPYWDKTVGQPPLSALPKGAIGWEFNFPGVWQPKFSQIDINRSQGKGPWDHLPTRTPYQRPDWARR